MCSERVFFAALGSIRPTTLKRLKERGRHPDFKRVKSDFEPLAVRINDRLLIARKEDVESLQTACVICWASFGSRPCFFSSSHGVVTLPVGTRKTLQ